MVFTQNARRRLSTLRSALLAIGAALLILIGQPWSGAHAAGATAANIAVGVVLPTQNEPRWAQDEARLRSVLAASGTSYELLYSQRDATVERSNVEKLISEGMRVLIICPTDATAAAPAVESARQAGVKVIAYDRLIRDTAAVDYYITFASVDVGAQQGQYLVDKAGGRTGIPLYLYAGHASDNNAFLFFQGAWSVLQPRIADGTFSVKNSSEAVALKAKAALTREEQARIIAQITTAWDWNVAADLARANLAAVMPADKGDVVILAPNDGTARAIAGAFAADTGVRSYVITGQDAEKASVQWIIDGKQSMTVFKDVRALAMDAAAAAVTFLNGGTPPATVTYDNGRIGVPSKPSQVITVDQNNVRTALIDSGYYQLSDFQWPVVSAEIPTSGAALASSFDSTTYQFQPGTFSGAVVVSHAPSAASMTGPGLADIGHSFDLAAVYKSSGEAAQPLKPYAVTIRYGDTSNSLVRESTLGLYYREGDRWVREPTSKVDAESNVITATPDHFSTWSVMGASVLVSWQDDFGSSTLNPRWSWLREDPTHWSLAAHPGFLRITTQKGRLLQSHNARNVLLTAAPAGDFDIRTRVWFNPTDNIQSAGLLVYLDDDNYLAVLRAYCGFASPCAGNAIYFDHVEQGGFTGSNFATALNPPGEAYLRLVRRGAAYTAYASSDGMIWSPVGTHNVSRAFTPSKVGLFANDADFGAPETAADFDFFAVEAQGQRVMLPLIRR